MLGGTLKKVGSLILFGLFLTGCEQQSSSAQQTSQSTAVTVASPLSRTVTLWDEYTGRFDAIESVDIRARVSGYLKEIQFRPGEMVEAGQVLFVIDQRPFDAALQSAQADLEASRAQLKLAENELERAQPLVSRGNISQSAFDERVQQKNIASASVKRAEATVTQAELDLEFTEVKAPVSGRIGRNLVSIGNLVTGSMSGSTVLASIVSLDPIHFYFTVSEADYLKYVRLGRSGERESSRTQANPVQIKLADETEFVHRGVMDFVDNRVSDSSGTVVGRAILDNKDLFLTPGLFGRVRLLAAENQQVILIPDAAVARDQTRRFVYLVQDDNTVADTQVELGGFYEDMRIVESGVTSEDKIVVSGLQFLRPGASILPETVELQVAKSEAGSQ